MAIEITTTSTTRRITEPLTTPVVARPQYPDGKQIMLGRMPLWIMDGVPEEAFQAGQRAYFELVYQDYPEYLTPGDYAELVSQYQPVDLAADSVEQWQAFFILGWSACVLGVETPGIVA